MAVAEVLDDSPAPEPAKARPARCACCGFRSEHAGFLRSVRVTLRGRALSVCPACTPHTPGPHDTRVSVTATAYALIAIFALIYRPEEWQSFTVIAILLTGMACGDFIATVVHELGHAGAAAAAGLRATEIFIGAGAPRWSLRLNGFWITVKSHPLGGGAACIHAPKGATRLQFAFAYLGGTLANLALFAPGVALLVRLATPGHEIPLEFFVLLMGMVVAQGWSALSALWPMKHLREGGISQSDGALVLELAREPWDADVQKLFGTVHQMRWLARAGRDRDRLRLAEEASARWPEQKRLFVTVLDATSIVEGDAAGLARWQAERHRLEPWGDDPAERYSRALVEGNVAWFALRTGDPAFRLLALEMSESALAGAPEEWPIQATRGAVLVANGEATAGLKLLTKALRQDGDLRDKADFCPWLARAERACGRPERAADYERLEAWLRRRHARGA